MKRAGAAMSFAKYATHPDGYSIPDEAAPLMDALGFSSIEGILQGWHGQRRPDLRDRTMRLQVLEMMGGKDHRVNGCIEHEQMAIRFLTSGPHCQ